MHALSVRNAGRVVGEKGVQWMKRVVDNSGKQSFVGSFTHVV